MPFEKRSPAMKTGAERISEYFDPKKHDQIVRRGELMAILSHLTKELTMPWYKKLWRWLARYYVRSATAPVAEEPEGKK